MVDLRAERERRGLSLAEASAKVRIPARYLAALETGDREILPDTPFRSGYQRQYLEFLGLDPDTPVLDRTLSSEIPDEPEEPTQTITMALEEIPPGRLLMSGFVLTMVVVLLLRVLFELTEGIAAPALTTEPEGEVAVGEALSDATGALAADGAGIGADGTEGTLPTLPRLRIRAIEPTRITTRVDNKDSYKGVLPGGEIIDLQGAKRIEVYAADLTTIRITYDGERIEPLGNLSKPRRLVFVQD